MAKKVYHLTISYDETDDSIEYLCETLEEESTNCSDIAAFEADVPGFKVVEIDISKYFDEPTLRLIRDCYEVAEA